MATTLTPFLNFNKQCAEAFRFYHQVLGGELTVQTYGDSPMKDHAPPELHDAVLTARLVTDGAVLMGCDVRPGVTVKPEGFEVALAVSDAAEADRIYAALAEGGEVTMPLQQSFGAKRFGMVTDRYGIPWMVSCEWVSCA
jgi:PhnB protein